MDLVEGAFLRAARPKKAATNFLCRNGSSSWQVGDQPGGLSSI